MYLEIQIPEISKTPFYFKIVRETTEFWLIQQQLKIGLQPKAGMNAKVNGKNNNDLMKISKTKHKFLQDFGLYYIRAREQLPISANQLYVYGD
jgi:hypothetical protein